MNIISPIFISTFFPVVIASYFAIDFLERRRIGVLFGQIQNKRHLFHSLKSTFLSERWYILRMYMRRMDMCLAQV